jgi:Tfp pilus assembly protein PilO
MKANQTQLLILLLAILAVKFVILPTIDWQDATIAKLSTLNKRLDKSIGFINQLPQMQLQQQQLAEHLTDLKSEIDSYQDLSGYQLNKQQAIEKLFADHRIDIKSFNWRDVIKTEQGAQLKLMIQYSGHLKDFLALHMQISELNRSVVVENLGLNIRGQDSNTMGVISGNIVLVFLPVEVADANV